MGLFLTFSRGAPAIAAKGRCASDFRRADQSQWRRWRPKPNGPRSAVIRQAPFGDRVLPKSFQRRKFFERLRSTCVVHPARRSRCDPSPVAHSCLAIYSRIERSYPRHWSSFSNPHPKSLTPRRKPNHDQARRQRAFERACSFAARDAPRTSGDRSLSLSGTDFFELAPDFSDRAFRTANELSRRWFLCSIKFSLLIYVTPADAQTPRPTRCGRRRAEGRPGANTAAFPGKAKPCGRPLQS